MSPFLFRRFLFISCSLHILLILLFFVKSTDKTQIKNENIEIEIVKAKLFKSKVGISNRGNSNKNLNKYLPPPANFYDTGMAVGRVTSVDEGDDPSSEWGDGAREFGRVKEFVLVDKVYTKINNKLYYPGVLAYHKIEGVVNARLTLNQIGECVWNDMKVNSSNAYLRVYILSLLKDFCTWKFEEQSLANLNIFDLSFQFKITETTLDLKKTKEAIVGNVLSFYRNVGHSNLEWNLGPIKGMFPIPWVAVNFGWIEENWDKIINHKDPMELYKNR